MSFKTITHFLITCMILSGCAMSYRTITPVSAFQHDTISEKKPVITITCSEIDVISAHNAWVKRKLERNGMELVPVKVENNTEEPFVISPNTIEIINDFTLVEMVEPVMYMNKLRQKIWPNLFLVPVALVASIKKEEVEMPGGGKGIREGFKLNFLSGSVALWCIINTTRTILVNNKSKKDILRNDLYLKSVPPKSVVYGVICIKAKTIKNPMIRIKTH
jgi:hypothetical protein